MRTPDDWDEDEDDKDSDHAGDTHKYGPLARPAGLAVAPAGRGRPRHSHASRDVPGPP
jgi:hypothetical protein